MATGKTHPKHITVTVDDSGGTARNISGSITSIGNIGITYDQSDVTTIANSVKQYLTGYGDASIDLSGPVNNDAAAAAPAETGASTILPALADSGNASTVTIAIGIRAAPTSGDPEFSGEFVCTGYVVNASTTDATWSASFKPAFGAAAPAWGTV
jgi:hypothetical protein